MNDYDRIERIIQYLDQHYGQQPSLAELADQVDLSPPHFHRLFSRWAGTTPKRFLQCLTLAHAKASLRAGRSVLDVALATGLSGPGRLHDLCVSLEAASPGELKSGGAGWTIQAGWAPSPFGLCLVGVAPRGICHLAFADAARPEEALAEVATAWPQAEVVVDQQLARQLVDSIFGTPARQSPPLRLLVRGSEFQTRVWRALLSVPTGMVVSYGQVACAVGRPAAARAVGSAVGQNALAYLIPCHRVIRETGVVGEYRWGSARKRAMLAWEHAAAPHDNGLGEAAGVSPASVPNKPLAAS